MLFSCQNLGKSFGPKVLFSGIAFGVEERDRLAIIGPNGSGKSSLLKIVAGLMEPDEGKVTPRKGLRIVYVSQQSEFDAHQTVYEAVERELKDLPGHDANHTSIINSSLGKLGFSDFSQQVGSLSGGWKKRLSFAVAIAQEPELLLLDEPTNHLDLEGIEWLERALKSANFAWVLVTHDRIFLEKLATRIIEVNKVYRAGLLEVKGNYLEFLTAKAEYISGQLQTQEVLANKVRREVEWLRRGPKARTTKQQARIQGAERLQQQLSDVSARNRDSKVQIEFNSSDRQTRKLISLKNVSKSFGDKKVIEDFTFNVTQGMRLGLLGLNASGKTTLLRILAGKNQVESGTVVRADKLRVVYFEQNRERLDPNQTLKRTLAPDGDSVIANDRSVHVVSWAKKFNFIPEQLDQQVGKLSGGEQARLLIALLMLEPADVLLLDEPTNDLDIPTLEVLEESLMEFRGAVVLVTHDRYMLDRVSNLLLALDGNGGIQEFADYYQWQQEQMGAQVKAAKKNEAGDFRNEPIKAKAQASKRLSYMEQREYDLMEKAIEDAEKLLQKCQSDVEDPSVASNSMRLQESYKAMELAQKQVERLYERWTELEQKIKGV